MDTRQRATRGDAERAVHEVLDLDLHTYIQQLRDDDRSFRYIARAIGDLTGGPTPSVQAVCNWGKS